MRRAGNSDQKVASSVGLWLKAAPLPIPQSRGILRGGSGLCTFTAAIWGAWPKDANKLSGDLNARARGPSYAEELEIRAFLRSALPTQDLLCCNAHCLFLRHRSTGGCLVLARDVYKVSPTKCFPEVTPLPTGKWLSQK